MTDLEQFAYDRMISGGRERGDGGNLQQGFCRGVGRDLG